MSSDLQQYLWYNSLVIVIIPESIRDNEVAVPTIAQALNVEVKPKDIDICNRVKGEKLNSVVVRFVSHKVKTYLYKRRVQLRDVHFAGVIPNASAADQAQANNCTREGIEKNKISKILLLRRKMAAKTKRQFCVIFLCSQQFSALN